MFGELLNMDDLLGELDALEKEGEEENAGPNAADQVAAAMAMDSVPNVPTGKI